MKYKNNINKLIKSKYGFMLCNKFDQYVGKAIIEYGEYSDDEVDLFRTLCSTDDVVIEVGSNIGSHTLPLAQIVSESGKVYAFEPQRFIFQTLCANIALNSLENVYCFQKAVSSTKGHLFLPKIQYNKIGNFGGISLQNKGDERVDVIKLDKFLTLDRLKLVKIDAEGMELEVLKGTKKLIRKHQPILLIENDRFDKHKELVEYIDILGYDSYWYASSLYNKDNFFNNKNNIYGQLLSSNMLCIPKGANMVLSNYIKVDIQKPHILDKLYS